MSSHKPKKRSSSVDVPNLAEPSSLSHPPKKRSSLVDVSSPPDPSSLLHSPKQRSPVAEVPSPPEPSLSPPSPKKSPPDPSSLLHLPKQRSPVAEVPSPPEPSLSPPSPKKQKATLDVTNSSQPSPTIANPLEPPQPNSPKKPPTAPSPKKREGNRPCPGNQKRGQDSKKPTLTVYIFSPDLGVEAYLYTKDDHNDGFLNTFSKFNKGELESSLLSEAGFTGYRPRRRFPGSSEVLTDSKCFWRFVILRYVRTTSTPETRQIGLGVLSEFFSATSNGFFPPSEIHSQDASGDGTTYFALDNFFRDDAIQQIIEAEIAPEELNTEFCTKYPALAAQLWSVGPYPEWARTILGFGMDT